MPPENVGVISIVIPVTVIISAVPANEPTGNVMPAVRVSVLVIVTVPENVPLEVIDAHAEATLTVIFVAPLVEVKKTASPAIGAAAPLAPPSVNAQLVVEFQLPVPPATKYLSVANKQIVSNTNNMVTIAFFIIL